MKLRIKGSSLRLRLTQGEVQELAERGEVEDSVRFSAGAALVYRLRRDATSREISAGYAENVVEIRVPERAALEWCRTDVVTLAHSQPGPDDELRIVIEKDFACLAPREEEDESDNFPHPQGTSGTRIC
jgi:hypothetical protein